RSTGGGERESAKERARMYSAEEGHPSYRYRGEHPRKKSEARDSIRRGDASPGRAARTSRQHPRKAPDPRPRGSLGEDYETRARGPHFRPPRALLLLIGLRGSMGNGTAACPAT